MQFRLPRHSDEFILTQLVELGKRHCTKEWEITVRLFSYSNPNNANGLSIKGHKNSEAPMVWHQNATLKTIAEAQGTVVNRFGLQLDNSESFVVERELNQPFDKGGASWNHDEAQRNPSILAPRAALASDAVKMLGATAPSTPIDVSIGTEFAKQIEARDASLTRLEELYARFTKELVEYRKETDERFRAEEAALRAETEKQRETLAAEFGRKEMALSEREHALETRLKEIDDRDAKHARRELRKSIITELNERNKEFKLTKGTRHLRWPVAGILGVVGILFLILLAQTVWISSSVFSASTVWTVAMTSMLVKQSLLTIGLLSVIWYAVRWNNEWFREHADEEFRSKAMLLDIERASWVVETAMEWRKATNGDIPASLIERLTDGLFTVKDRAPNAQTPDLASLLLGASSKVRLNLGDQGEVELDRKGAKQVKRAIER